MTTPLGSPVNEVVVSIAFPHNRALSGPFLGASVGGLMQRYPNVQQQPPYEMPVELPPKKGTPGAIPQVQLFLSTQALEPRFWLVSEDEIALVQIQANYLAYNWRRRREGQIYPGFESLVESFEQLKNEVEDGVRRGGNEPLRPAQAEVTYINIVSPSDLWSGHSEMARVLAVDFAELEKAEQFSIAYSKQLVDSSGAFVGRVHVAATPAIEVSNGGPAINLTLTARSGNLDTGETTAGIDFIKLAHEHIRESFRSLTTDAARRRWGVK